MERCVFTAQIPIRAIMLSSVEPTPAVRDLIVRDLGVGYDFSNMLTHADLKLLSDSYDKHNTVVATLQKYGFPKIGLQGQEPLTMANKNRYSQRSLTELISSSKALQRELSALFGSEKKLPELVKEVKESLLQRSEYNRAAQAQKDLARIAASFKWKLDPWQIKMVRLASAGESILVHGPTSGGKTFATTAALGEILKNNEKKLLYVAPTFQLALQTYANLSKTFPNFKVSLLTGTINYIAPESRIYIGTPRDLWTYLSTVSDNKFHIGIFDEIHTISLTGNKDRDHAIRAEAIGNLLTLCPLQVAALSATINPEDLASLRSYISARTGIRRIVQVDYTERPVPLENYVLTPKGIEAPTSEVEPLPVTPARTFAMLREMEDREMLPALIFEPSEQDAFNRYLAYVNWIEAVDEKIFPHWNKMREIGNAEIDAYNEALGRDQLYSIYENVYRTGGDRRFDAIIGKVRAKAKQRSIIIGKVRHLLARQIIASLKSQEFLVSMPRGYKSELASAYRALDLPLPSTVPELIPAETRDLLTEYKNYKPTESDSLRPDDIAPLARVCDSVPYYLRIGERASEMKQLLAIIGHSGGKESSKIRAQMDALKIAEHIDDDAVMPLFKLIARGLEYGIGIVVPTMPFAVQFQMLRMLTSRSLKVIYVSQSMAMGVNYPVRSVVIRGDENTIRDINPIIYHQMAGRAGRRRLDDRAMIIHWNVGTRHAVFPRITFPEPGGGLLFTEIDSLAPKIHNLSQRFRVSAKPNEVTQAFIPVLMRGLGFTEEDVKTTLTAYHNLLNGVPTPAGESYYWAERWELLKSAIQELDTRMAAVKYDQLREKIFRIVLIFLNVLTYQQLQSSMAV